MRKRRVSQKERNKFKVITEVMSVIIIRQIGLWREREINDEPYVSI